MTVSVYFDSSALVKLMIEEEGSNIAEDLWNTCDNALSSRLTYPETRAALAAANRNHVLDRGVLARAERRWAAFWGAIRPIELSSDIGRRAGDLAAKQALGGGDAVHLASALALDDLSLVVAVWDRRLHAAVRAEGLVAAPARLAG